ncbi:MAG: hypothetical protein N3E51_05340, partial [Candidatus Micrarchaeota archaeon]|nr:hypothetical protein [Candidatus Micrarchaeota archaeon]
VKSTLYYNDGKTETKIYDFTKEAEQERYRSDLKKFGATDEQIIEVLNEILNQLKIQPTVKKNPIYTEFMGPLQTIEQQKQRKKEEEMNEQKTKAKEKAEKEESEKFA